MKPNCVWPWFFSAVPIIGFSTTYAILWWTGDVFGPQLTMSVAEFVMSLAINVGIFEILILILKITFKIIKSSIAGDSYVFLSPNIPWYILLNATNQREESYQP